MQCSQGVTASGNTIGDTQAGIVVSSSFCTSETGNGDANQEGNSNPWLGGEGILKLGPGPTFSNQTTDLEDVWGASVRGLRDRLRELPDPQAKLQLFEAFLLQKSAANLARNYMVQFAVSRLQIWTPQTDESAV